jgi:hypothetical protein
MVVVIPLFLFGMGMASWTASQHLPWDVSVVAMLWVGGIAATYLRRNPGVMLAAQLAMWSAAALMNQSFAAGVAVLVVGVIAVMVAREQIR